MTINMNEAKAAPVERDAAAEKVAEIIHELGKDTKEFTDTEYLTVNITKGKGATLWELRQRFPHIDIFKLPNIEIYKTNISAYRLDKNFGVNKRGGT